MKRTRRIEVIRYRSWVTETSSEPAAPFMADEQQAGDSMVDLLVGIPPTSEPERVNCDGLSPDGDVAADHRPAHRSFLRLRALFRLRQ